MKSWGILGIANVHGVLNRNQERLIFQTFFINNQISKYYFINFLKSKLNMSKFIFYEKMFVGVLLLLLSTGNVLATENILTSSDANVDGVQQQGRTVTLTVSDDMGPLTGVNVIVKGTTNGGITDLDGRIQIQNVPANAIFVVSYIGFITQEISVGDRTTLSITLDEDTQALEEVVVVGYGVQRRSQVTGAISQVRSEEIENRAFTDATQALQGKTSGVQVFFSSGAPGTTGGVRVRGMGSNTNNEPLYVVDGRQVRDIGYLDSDDIQSIEILKDASAAAIYGARAGNGVVLITTKQGETRPTGKIEYRFMQSWQSNNNVPKVLNAQQYYDYQMQLSPANQTAMDTDWGNKTTDTDWLGLIFGTGHLSRHNLSFSGGNNEIRYYVAGSALTNDGPVVGSKDKIERYTGTLNGEYQVKPWLKITTNNNFSVNKSGGGYNVFAAAMRYSPLIPATVSEPTDYMQSYLDRGYMLYQDENGNYPTLPVYPSADNVNPLITLNRTNQSEKTSRINGTTSLILTPIAGLTFTSRLGYSFDGQRTYQQTLPGVSSSQSMTYNQTVTATDRTREYYQWENFANYSKSFGKHNTTFMAGMSFIQDQVSFVRGTVNGTGSDIGFPSTDPLYAYFAYKSGGWAQTTEGGEEEIGRKIAYYGRFNYDYDNRYFFQATFRADAADLEVLPPDGRWGYFPAFSVGWTISNESFMSDYKAISHLKLRASWGQNGSTSGLNNYRWQSAIGAGETAANGNLTTVVYSFVPDQMTYISGKAPSSAGNNQLKWETAEQLDLGLDARFLNNRLSFTYDYYQKSTIDFILTGVTPSYVMGINASPFNVGKVTNTGHEFELGWRDNITRDFRYSINANISAGLKNEVKEITSTITSIEGSSQDSHTITWLEQGYPMWHFKTYHYTGVDSEGNPTFLDLNNNGTIDPDDKIDCGSGLPTYTYGLTISASYKNFDLTVFGSGQGGNKIFQAVTRAFQLQSNVPAYLLENAWSETNRNTNIPKIGMDNIGYYYVSDAQIYKGDYFKLKQMQIGYTLPRNLMRTIGIENLRIYASCENLFTITNYPGFDPEIMNAGSSTTSASGIGIDSGRYPNNRNYILGVNVTF